MALSTDHILKKVIAVSRRLHHSEGQHLDVGAGTGHLIELMREVYPGMASCACDYTDSLMQLDGQQIDIVNLNYDALPYDGESFDLVTCTEVVEHLENYRRLIREVFRVTKRDGLVIFSTPNILSLRSRLRFLFFGFWNLFGPLPVGRPETFTTRGHINPVSHFYLAHALAETGFTLCPLEVDRFQRSALPALLILWPFITLLGLVARQREGKYQTIDGSNRGIVSSMNTVKMLLGRTIVVSARKPNGPVSVGQVAPGGHP